MDGKDYKKAGNSILFGILLTSNVVLMILGLLLSSIGIYSCEKNKNFADYNGSFCIIGLLIVITCFIGHGVRYSPLHLFIYEVCLLVLFILQLIFTSLNFNDSHLDSSLENINLYRFALIQTIIIIILSFVVGGWYWKTLENNNKTIVVSLNQPSLSPFIKH